VCSIQIVDFGESFFSKGEEITKLLQTAIPMSAPETLFKEPVGPGVDIWALACVLYWLLGGHTLFESFWASRDEVLVQMVRMLGKLPERMWYKWEERIGYFHKDGCPKPSARQWAGGPISLE
jgi:serine/threonine protein kinase